MRQAVSFVCVDLGFNFTQQNSKVDLLFNLGISYEEKSNRFALKVEDTFGRQDVVPDIERRELGIAYARELGKRWLLLFGTSARRNTQLNLDQGDFGPRRSGTVRVRDRSSDPRRVHRAQLSKGALRGREMR